MASIGLLVLRVISGMMMLLAHGWGKLMKFGELSETFPDPIGWGSQVSLGLAVFSEVLCSIFVVLGIFTRYAALFLVLTMAAAFFLHHANDPFQQRELAALYLAAFTTILIAGGGKYSIQTLFE